MERVAFVIERTAERIGCLLNPESLELRRRAGLVPAATTGGLLGGQDLADDPPLFTGGGTTELTLNLLFDVSLAGSTLVSEDVRDLTNPLWQLAENSHGQPGDRRPPVVRFVWGKAWNWPAVVTAVAERLEDFTAEGTPRRSWLRLRLLRVAEPLTDDVPEPVITPPIPPADWLVGAPPALGDTTAIHEVLGSHVTLDQITTAGGERLDQLAYRYYGDPSLWRLLAWANGLLDPLRLAGGEVLSIPAAQDFEEAS
ncbi:hypothetical protein ABC977_15230 [Thioalkalicoccus limnaeus]|uniref:Contractile injection system tube protein N-terminal domain-containing protein n=1 Tax=Thioalkalicoccus limnaeus TaxID=120681 RepID=A0ABV4BGU3_9GAMM